MSTEQLPYDCVGMRLRCGIKNVACNRNNPALNPFTNQFVAANEPRYVPSQFRKGLFIEEATINISPNPTNFSAWSNSNITYASANKTFANGDVGNKLTANTTAAYTGTATTFTAFNVPWTLTVRVGKGTAPYFMFLQSDGAFIRGVAFDLTTGAFVSHYDNTHQVTSYLSNKVLNMDGSWDGIWDFSITITPTSNSNRYFSFQHNPTWASTQVGEYGYLIHEQIEQKAWPTTFTTSSRSDEVYLLPVTGNMTYSQGYLSFWATVPARLSGQAFFDSRASGYTDTNNNWFGAYIPAGNNMMHVCYSTGATYERIVTSIPFPIGVPTHVYISWKASPANVAVYVNGVLVGQSSVAPYFYFGANLQIGSIYQPGYTAAILNGSISDFRIATGIMDNIPATMYVPPGYNKNIAQVHATFDENMEYARVNHLAYPTALSGSTVKGQPLLATAIKSPVLMASKFMEERTTYTFSGITLDQKKMIEEYFLAPINNVELPFIVDDFVLNISTPNQYIRNNNITWTLTGDDEYSLTLECVEYL